MKKYLIKTFALLTVSALGFMFILSPMMTSAKDYSLAKYAKVSFAETSFKANAQATYHGDGNIRWSYLALAPLRISGTSQSAQTLLGSSDAVRVKEGYQTKLYVKVRYLNMGMSFDTNSELITWTFVESTSTLK